MEDRRKIAQGAIQKLLEAGGDKAQCKAVMKETKEFNVNGGVFSLFRTLFDKSLTLAVIKDHKVGNVSINRFDEESVGNAVAECIQVAEFGNKDEAFDIAPNVGEHTLKQGIIEPDIDKLFQRTKELVENIEERHPKIIIEEMVVTHEKEQICYLNSNGTSMDLEKGKYQVSLVYSAHEGERNSSFYGSEVDVDNLDRPFIELGLIERELSEVERQIDTIPVDDNFTGTIIVSPGCLGSLLQSMVSNFVSDQVLLDGTSIWKDKIGQKVADERLTISLKPKDPRIVCGECITSDGFLSQDYDLIKEGVLESFALSLYVANKTGQAPAKNRGLNLVIEPGDTPLEEMIAGITKGIIVSRFSGGNPSANGEFSGVAKNSFMIEDGKITNPISETMINGNLADLLNHIVAISQETLVDGTCVLPYIAFDNVVISGK